MCGILYFGIRYMLSSCCWTVNKLTGLLDHGLIVVNLSQRLITALSLWWIPEILSNKTTCYWKLILVLLLRSFCEFVAKADYNSGQWKQYYLCSHRTVVQWTWQSWIWQHWQHLRRCCGACDLCYTSVVYTQPFCIVVLSIANIFPSRASSHVIDLFISAV